MYMYVHVVLYSVAVLHVCACDCLGCAVLLCLVVVLILLASFFLTSLIKKHVQCCGTTKSGMSVIFMIEVHVYT